MQEIPSRASEKSMFQSIVEWPRWTNPGDMTQENIQQQPEVEETTVGSCLDKKGGRWQGQEWWRRSKEDMGRTRGGKLKEASKI